MNVSKQDFIIARYLASEKKGSVDSGVSCGHNLDVVLEHHGTLVRHGYNPVQRVTLSVNFGSE